MPIYEYRCEECDHRFEIIQRLDEGADGLTCPGCGAPRLAKMFSTFAAAATQASTAEPASAGCCRGTPT